MRQRDAEHALQMQQHFSSGGQLPVPPALASKEVTRAFLLCLMATVYYDYLRISIENMTVNPRIYGHVWSFYSNVSFRIRLWLP